MKRGPRPNAEKVERNQIILERWLNGEKLEAIGDSYGVTRERIRKVVTKAQANLGVSEDPKIIDRIIARRTPRGRFLGAQLAAKSAVRRKLKEHFKSGFDRDEIIRILEMGDDPDIQAAPDEALCALVFESLKIRRFFKYTRCSGCEEVKLSSVFPDSAVLTGRTCYCTKCSTDRHRQMMLQNPELQRRAYQVMLSKPNKARIYQLRHHYRAQGQEDQMPPLPPKGVPDSEVVVPPRKPRGDSLKAWRESVGRTFNRAKAAEKAKQIVKDDAASRHIYAE